MFDVVFKNMEPGDETPAKRLKRDNAESKEPQDDTEPQRAAPQVGSVEVESARAGLAAAARFWYYTDADGANHGPFDPSAMREWFDAG